MEEILKLIRTKGYDVFCKTGRLPTKIIMNNNDFANITYYSKDVRKCNDGKTYFEDLEIIIDTDIKELEME